MWNKREMKVDKTGMAHMVSYTVALQFNSTPSFLLIVFILSHELSCHSRSCFPSRQSTSLHLPLITPSLVPHYLHLV